MKQCVLYNRVSGEILGRIVTSKDPAKYESASVGYIEIDDQEFHSRPELFAKVEVDNETKERIALSAAEVATKIGGGISEEKASEMLAAFKIQVEKEKQLEVKAEAEIQN